MMARSAPRRDRFGALDVTMPLSRTAIVALRFSLALTWPSSALSALTSSRHVPAIPSIPSIKPPVGLEIEHSKDFCFISCLFLILIYTKKQRQGTSE